MRSVPKIVAAQLALLLTLAFGGVRSESPGVSREPDRAQVSRAGREVAYGGRSLVRLVNAIPAQNDLAISGGDYTIFSGIAYGSVSPYAVIRDNSVTFRLRAAGSESTLAVNHGSLADGYRYTIVALAGERGEARLRILWDDVAADGNRTRIRVVNAAPGAGMVDVLVRGAKQALFTNLQYGTNAGYREIAAASRSIEIRSDSRRGSPLLLRHVHFEAGKAYTIVLTDGGPERIDAITFEDSLTSHTLSSGH
jgi:hypothetical protein